MNARVWTADSRRPWADAVLVRGASLAGVGSSAEIRKRAGADTLVIDAQGRTVVPTHLVGRRHAADHGILRAGMQASFVMLDRALDRVDADSVSEAHVVLAIVAGIVQFDSEGFLPRS